MRLKNYTDIPTEQIRELIRAVRPSGISNFDVRVSNFNGSTGRGRAYTQGSGYHDRADPFVVISLAPAAKFKRAKCTKAAAVTCPMCGVRGWKPWCICSRTNCAICGNPHTARGRCGALAGR